MEAAQKAAVEMGFVLLEIANAILIIMEQTVKTVNLSISLTVATYAHLIKALAISFQCKIIKDILAANA